MIFNARTVKGLLPVLLTVATVSVATSVALSQNSPAQKTGPQKLLNALNAQPQTPFSKCVRNKLALGSTTPVTKDQLQKIAAAGKAQGKTPIKDAVTACKPTTK